MTFDAWASETFDDSFRISVKVRQTLFAESSPYQKVEVFDTERWGRVLMIDGLFMTSERDEFVYHELLTHPALCSAPAISRVVIIGGGDGGCAREVLRHPEVQSVSLVEIDRLVVEASQKFLPSIGTAWDDPRLEVRIEDGVEYIANLPPASTDVILLDSSDPVGPAEGLFNATFFAACRRALKPGGVLALQSGSPFLMPKTFRDTQRVIAESFGCVEPYFANVPLYGSAIWSWTYASDQATRYPKIAQRWGSIAETCKYYNLDIHDAVFAAPTYVRRLLR